MSRVWENIASYTTIQYFIASRFGCPLLTKIAPPELRIAILSQSAFSQLVKQYQRNTAPEKPILGKISVFKSKKLIQLIVSIIDANLCLVR